MWFEFLIRLSFHNYNMMCVFDVCSLPVLICKTLWWSAMNNSSSMLVLFWIHWRVNEVIFNVVSMFIATAYGMCVFCVVPNCVSFPLLSVCPSVHLSASINLSVVIFEVEEHPPPPPDPTETHSLSVNAGHQWAETTTAPYWHAHTSTRTWSRLLGKVYCMVPFHIVYK